MRFIIAKVNFNPKLGRHQAVQFLMDAEHRLFSAQNFEEAHHLSKSLFNQKLEIGNSFYQQNHEKYYFANFENLENSTNSTNNPLRLPEGWQFVPASELSQATCPDYKVIQLAIQKLGYQTDLA